MGKFANTNEEYRAAARAAAEAEGIPFEEESFSLSVGTYLGASPRFGPDAGNLFHDKSEFEALGLPVPFYRRSAGIRHLRAMGFEDREQMDRIVGRMSANIERDDSHMALEEALQMGLDVTGCYRLLAVLLCEPRPAPVESPATFVDLVEA